MKTNANDLSSPKIIAKSKNGLGIVTEYESTGGLTKRELFAAMAMQGCISANHFEKYQLLHSDIVNISVKLADELIKSLNKEL